jgi:23S rRNA pseudouridine1911/1915/1917 synthase
MTTRREKGREAITHYVVKQRIDSALGKFTLLELKIDTGRTHQIRVHLSSLGHPVVGDALYCAPRELRGKSQHIATLTRNFLHAAELKFQHPRTGEKLWFSAELPLELREFLNRLAAH